MVRPSWAIAPAPSRKRKRRSCPIRREGCLESVLGCLPRGNRAGGDLGDCSQYSARAGRPCIYDALHTRLGAVTQSLLLPCASERVELYFRLGRIGSQPTFFWGASHWRSDP